MAVIRVRQAPSGPFEEFDIPEGAPLSSFGYFAMPVGESGQYEIADPSAFVAATSCGYVRSPLCGADWKLVDAAAGVCRYLGAHARYQIQWTLTVSSEGTPSPDVCQLGAQIVVNGESIGTFDRNQSLEYVACQNVDGSHLDSSVRIGVWTRIVDLQPNDTVQLVGVAAASEGADDIDVQHGVATMTRWGLL